MPSTRVPIAKETWVNVTNDTSGGSIRYVGKHPLMLTQATSAPASLEAAVISGVLDAHEEYATYYGLPSGENVYAYCAIADTSVIVSNAD